VVVVGFGDGIGEDGVCGLCDGWDREKGCSFVEYVPFLRVFFLRTEWVKTHKASHPYQRQSPAMLDRLLWRAGREARSGVC
jgi:hypothetical protein